MSCPSPNVCPNFGNASNYFCVHSFYPFDHRPVQSDPYGFRMTTNRSPLPSTSAQNGIGVVADQTLDLDAWDACSATVGSLLALLNSSSQNCSESRMSYHTGKFEF